MTVDSVSALLSALSARYSVVRHAAADSYKAWTEIVRSMTGDPLPTKTLVLKPGKAMTDVSAILVVSLESTTFSIGALGKSLGSKDIRVATEDLVKSVLKVEKLDVTPFAMADIADKQSIKVLVDHNMTNAKQQLAFRAFAADQSFIVAPEGLNKFLAVHGGKYDVLDFADLDKTANAPPEKLKKDLQQPEGEKEVLIGITAKKNEDFPSWYQQVVVRTEMLDYYDISGCYILRPWAYAIWKQIQKFFGGAIEELGVEDCYFPMFVPEKSLTKEKDHIEGFSPEVAWVTRAGQSELAEPIAVRPTSETVMYPYYSNWIKSHRDLPLRLNQWCNVVRWEFKHPQPFLRTREFLWQEGHTAFATKEESDVEVRQILDLYRRVYEELLAVPVIEGRKSEKEKFAGGLYTTTVEGFIPTTGRAIQGATSHSLGQNFSKMFNIVAESASTAEQQFVWQNSWGLTTRTIGVMVMIHGDDKGLILPPRVASVQVVVMPVGINSKTSDEQRKALTSKAEELHALLRKAGIRSKCDLRDNYTAGFKFNHWELRGVPVRLEIGPKDLAKNETRSVRRDTGESEQIPLSKLVETLEKKLETIQSDMFAKAKKERDSHLIRLETWDKFVETLNNKNIVLTPWCEQVKCEESVKDRSTRM